MPVVSGDPFGPIKPEKKDGSVSPEEVKSFHAKSDVDASILAHHHTLGAQRNQAASGDHNHNGENSRKLGEGEGLAITGLLAPATVAQVDAILDSLISMLSNVIEFTDSRS